MIDWLGGLRPLEVILMMTAVMALGVAVVEHGIIPLTENVVDAPR